MCSVQTSTGKTDTNSYVCSSMYNVEFCHLLDFCLTIVISNLSMLF